VLAFLVLILLLVGVSLLEFICSILRTQKRIRLIRARVGALSTERLREIMQTPTHPDSQFALAELMWRGVDTRPSQEQLFGMLTSGNPVLCGQAMVNLQVFYPEFSLPEEASNQDSPELWQKRVEAFRRVA
jgi:hypothetical protein